MCITLVSGMSEGIRYCITNNGGIHKQLKASRYRQFFLSKHAGNDVRVISFHPVMQDLPLHQPTYLFVRVLGYVDGEVSIHPYNQPSYGRLRTSQESDKPGRHILNYSYPHSFAIPASQSALWFTQSSQQSPSLHSCPLSQHQPT